MKRAYRHSEPKKPLSKPRKKRASKAASVVPKTAAGNWSHPIFHTQYAGKTLKYIRPFDPVWPTEEPQLWPNEKPKS